MQRVKHIDLVLQESDIPPLFKPLNTIPSDDNSETNKFLNDINLCLFVMNGIPLNGLAQAEHRDELTKMRQQTNAVKEKHAAASTSTQSRERAEVESDLKNILKGYAPIYSKICKDVIRAQRMTEIAGCETLMAYAKNKYRGQLSDATQRIIKKLEPIKPLLGWHASDIAKLSLLIDFTIATIKKVLTDNAYQFNDPQKNALYTKLEELIIFRKQTLKPAVDLIIQYNKLHNDDETDKKVVLDSVTLTGSVIGKLNKQDAASSTGSGAASNTTTNQTEVLDILFEHIPSDTQKTHDLLYNFFVVVNHAQKSEVFPKGNHDDFGLERDQTLPAIPTKTDVDNALEAKLRKKYNATWSDCVYGGVSYAKTSQQILDEFMQSPAPTMPAETSQALTARRSGAAVMTESSSIGQSTPAVLRAAISAITSTFRIPRFMPAGITRFASRFLPGVRPANPDIARLFRNTQRNITRAISSTASRAISHNPRRLPAITGNDEQNDTSTTTAAAVAAAPATTTTSSTGTTTTTTTMTAAAAAAVKTARTNSKNTRTFKGQYETFILTTIRNGKMNMDDFKRIMNGGVQELRKKYPNAEYSDLRKYFILTMAIDILSQQGKILRNEIDPTSTVGLLEPIEIDIANTPSSLLRKIKKRNHLIELTNKLINARNNVKTGKFNAQEQLDKIKKERKECTDITAGLFSGNRFGHSRTGDTIRLVEELLGIEADVNKLEKEIEENRRRERRERRERRKGTFGKKRMWNKLINDSFDNEYIDRKSIISMIEVVNKNIRNNNSKVDDRDVDLVIALAMAEDMLLEQALHLKCEIAPRSPIEPLDENISNIESQFTDKRRQLINIVKIANTLNKAIDSLLAGKADRDKINIDSILEYFNTEAKKHHGTEMSVGIRLAREFLEHHQHREASLESSALSTATTTTTTTTAVTKKRKVVFGLANNTIKEHEIDEGNNFRRTPKK